MTMAPRRTQTTAKAAETKTADENKTDEQKAAEAKAAEDQKAADAKAAQEAKAAEDAKKADEQAAADAKEAKERAAAEAEANAQKDKLKDEEDRLAAEAARTEEEQRARAEDAGENPDKIDITVGSENRDPIPVGHAHRDRAVNEIDHAASGAAKVTQEEINEATRLRTLQVAQFDTSSPGAGARSVFDSMVNPPDGAVKAYEATRTGRDDDKKTATKKTATKKKTTTKKN
jgi:chromosome segregation ATPase